MFIDLIGSYGRGISLGVRRYAEETGTWHCRFASTWPVGIAVDLSNWNVDGWIGYADEFKLGEELRRRPVPLVCISSVEARRGRRPTVVCDNHAIGRMAFDYLFDRGFRHFGFVGHRNAAFSVEREEGFCQAVEQLGYKCATFDYNYQPPSRIALLHWLRAQPQPLGVLCDNDDIGVVILDVCREHGLAVPQQIAVLSVDDDELLCTARFPTLSSIRNDTTRIGYEAAAMLDRLLDGEPPPSRPLRVPPLGVTTRQSTDALAFADPEVSRAVQFIRACIDRPTSVQDVVRNATVSTRALELRFRREMNCSILQYIHRQHVERARSMLADPHYDWSIEQVARASGFSSPTRFGIVFRRHTGMTPTQYRQRFRDIGGRPGAEHVD